MLRERPVESLFRHPQCDDHVDSFTLLRSHGRQVMQGVRACILIRVIDEIRYTNDASGIAAAYFDNPGTGFGPFHDSDGVENETDFFEFVLGGLARVHVGDVDDCLLVKVQHFVDRIGVATLIEVVADPQMLEVPVPVELVVIVESNRCELGFVLR